VNQPVTPHDERRKTNNPGRHDGEKALPQEPGQPAHRNPQHVKPRHGRSLQHEDERQQRAQAEQGAQDDWGRLPTEPVPLILREDSMSMAEKLPAQPGRAILYYADDGRLVQLHKPPRLIAARHYKWRYEVDVSDHYASYDLTLPSRTTAAKFRLIVDAGWRVVEPARVVTSRISDGNLIVRSRIIEALLPICRSYAIEEDGPLEQNLAGALGGGRVHTYPEGITVFRFSVQVDHERRAATRIANSADMIRLREQVTSDEDLLLMLIVQNPDSLYDVINDVRERKKLSVDSRISLFNKLVDNDLVQSADLDWVRDQLVRPIGEIVGSSPTGAFGVVETPAPRSALDRPRARDAREDERQGQGADHENRDAYMDDDEDEDIMPADIVDDPEDGVTGFRRPAWLDGSDRYRGDG
jgi:hypothetical protein